MGLNASSRFLKRYSVPKPFILICASFPVLRLTSTSAVNISVKIRLTYSLVEEVTRDSDANEI